MPASTTYKYQLIDAIGKVFKDHMFDAWSTWMLEENDKLGLTPAGNRRHPTIADCIDWIGDSWKKIKRSNILNAVEKCYMKTDPGPPIEGYLDLDQFQEGIVENEEDLIEEDIEEDS